MALASRPRVKFNGFQLFELGSIGHDAVPSGETDASGPEGGPSAFLASSPHSIQSSPKSSEGCGVGIVPLPQSILSTAQYLSQPQQIFSGLAGLMGNFLAMDDGSTDKAIRFIHDTSYAAGRFDFAQAPELERRNVTKWRAA